jgi:hypothetical protein
MLCCNWFTNAFEVVSVPSWAPVVQAARPVTDGCDAVPVTSTYRNPCTVNRGS